MKNIELKTETRVHARTLIYTTTHPEYTNYCVVMVIHLQSFPVTLPFRCDFEDSGTCGMKTDSYADIDWVYSDGQMSADTNGPTTDHTFYSG